MRKKCKRKVWNKINPIEHAISGASLIPESLQEKKRLRELSAIDAFARGMANVHDMQLMSDMSNISEQLALSGFGPEALEAVKRHEEALVKVARRAEENGEYSATADEVKAFRDVQEYYDLQRQVITRAQWEQAFDKAKRRSLSGAPGIVKL